MQSLPTASLGEKQSAFILARNDGRSSLSVSAKHMVFVFPACWVVAEQIDDVALAQNVQTLMPVKRRINKRREQFCEDAERWLRGEASGFFEFKDADELAALWAEYGDPKVAVWG